MMDKMNELEQQILECWQIVDDVNLLYEQVMDKDLHKDPDKLANALLGLHTVYGMKFEKAFDTYEVAMSHYFKETKTDYPDNFLATGQDKQDDESLAFGRRVYASADDNQD